MIGAKGQLYTGGVHVTPLADPILADGRDPAHRVLGTPLAPRTSTYTVSSRPQDHRSAILKSPPECILRYPASSGQAALQSGPWPPRAPSVLSPRFEQRDKT